MSRCAHIFSDSGRKSRATRRIAKAVWSFCAEFVEPRVLLSAFTPPQMKKAYGIDSISLGGTAGDGLNQTIAIVVAYHNPSLVSSVDEFNNTPAYGFTLPRFQNGTTVTTGPKLTVIDQAGGTSYPAESTDPLWDDEECIDVEWAHAVAPQANIVVVEANRWNPGDGFADMYTAEAEAAGYNGSGGDVSVVSNSWDTTESSTESTHDSTFVTPSAKAAANFGVAFLVAAGDEGAMGEYPSMSPKVISVGGTSLSVNGSGNWQDESVWNDHTQFASGGGLSRYESPSSAQVSNDNGIGNVGGTAYRATPDVTMDADLNTGGRSEQQPDVHQLWLAGIRPDDNGGDWIPDVGAGGTSARAVTAGRGMGQAG